ncbi:MAG: hypothetical protein ABL876_06730 [Chitinophagaceae bacterium]
MRMLWMAVVMACLSSSPVAKSSSTEVIEFRTQSYDTIGNQFSKPFMVMHQKAWYRDSMAIEEVSSINIISHYKSSRTETVGVMYYRFNDLRNRFVYEYKTFSDTATLIRKYAFSDTVPIAGGWNFRFDRNIDYKGIPDILSDTLIDKISYKRIQFPTGTKEYPSTSIHYSRCDKKGTVFNTCPLLSKKMDGCPVVKSFTFSLVQKGPAYSSEVNFLADRFTPEEEKVFNAWQKFARMSPIRN